MLGWGEFTLFELGTIRSSFLMIDAQAEADSLNP
jgi:hypothetical protein